MPLGMDLTAWFGPQGVFSSGDPAHIFGSGCVLPDSHADKDDNCEPRYYHIVTTGDWRYSCIV
jgi:hypothetical protein